MKDKILFWVDIEFVYFGIAKNILENYDCDAYAIIDVNKKAKKFFDEQKIIKFNKVWYYLDEIKSGKNTDVDYLVNFEKKYNIKLWNLIYSDRSFYKFNEHYKFFSNEILNIVEQECKFYEKILDEIKPDFLIIKMTDWHHNQLLYDLCKAKGIKILMTIPTRFGFRCIISEQVDKMDAIERKEKYQIEHLENYLQSFNSFKQATRFTDDYQRFNLHKVKSTLEFFLNLSNTNYQKRFSNKGRTRLKILKKYLSFSLKLKIRQSFIFFPLHYEPERTLSTDAPYFTNQLETITNIAKSLPINFRLYVKEHPVMKTMGWRSISYYKKILELPNVKLIHPSLKPVLLYKKCALVITITGTAGLEAAIYKKPTIVLSNVIYSEIPSVYRLKSIEDLPNMILQVLEKNHDFSKVKDFVEKVHESSFEFDSNKLATDFSSMCYYGGFLTDLDLDYKKVTEFLDKNQELFKKSALQHIIKINELKNL
jgi:hypothetical protein